MQPYTKEELETKLIRPLKAGESFLVSKHLELNASKEMYDYCDKWLTVSYIQRSNIYMFNHLSIEEDGKITSYRAEEDDSSWRWYPYHINIFETNIRMIEKDNTLSPNGIYLRGLPNI